MLIAALRSLTKYGLYPAIIFAGFCEYWNWHQHIAWGVWWALVIGALVFIVLDIIFKRNPISN
jgi:hypothetical protein